MRGTIETIEEKKTKNQKTYYLLTIGGQKYSFWDVDKIKSLQPGILIEFDFVQKGDFRNLSDFTIVPQSSSTEKNQYYDSKTWNTCLMCAKDLVVAMINAGEQKGAYNVVEIKEKTSEIARYLYHANEENEPEPPKEDDIPF